MKYLGVDSKGSKYKGDFLKHLLRKNIIIQHLYISNTSIAFHTSPWKYSFDNIYVRFTD